jgi:hypothetical protein
MNTLPSLSSRAAALSAASKSILPLACAATASAASMNFDFFGSALFDNSGWFVSTLTVPPVGGGITQGTGFKLYGSDSITDSAFYRYDSYYEQTVPRYDGDGLALLWGGSINGSLTAGDVLSAPFDFSYAFTHTPAFEGDTYISNNWKLTLGIIDWYGEEPINWATDASNSGFGSAITSSYTDGYESEAGSFSHTGNLSLTVDQWMLDSYTPSHWFVRLEVLVNHENSSSDYEPPYPRWNGDTLTVTVPQNSIDLTYSPIPEPSSLLLAAAGGLFVFRRRRNP